MGLSRLSKTRSITPEQAPVAPSRDATPESQVADALVELLERHGVPCDRHDDSVALNGRLPALRGHWTPQQHHSRLDIEVRLDRDTNLLESFAGRPTTDPPSALGDAFHNFCVNSFHGLLSALWGIDEPEQITVETWTIGGMPFTAIIGNLGTRGTTDEPASIADGLFDALARAIRQQPLPPQLHWFRFFVGRVGDAPTFESLQDDEPWEPAIATLKAMPWRTSTGYCSVRLFLMLKPASA